MGDRGREREMCVRFAPEKGGRESFVPALGSLVEMPITCAQTQPVGAQWRGVWRQTALGTRAPSGRARPRTVG